MRFRLPDCRHLGDEFFLTPAQRRELLLLMAEKGEAGLEEFVARHAADDSTIAQRIARIRQKLEEEAEELRRRLTSEYDRRRQDEQDRARALMDRLRSQEEELRAREGRMDASLADEIAARVRHVPLIELAMGPPPRISAWRRALRWVRHVWTRFKRWIRRLMGRARPEPKAKGLVLGVGAGPGVQVDLDIEEALALNPKFRKKVRRALGDTPWVRAKRMARILLGLDDYAEVAQRIMQEEANRAAQEREAELEKERDELRQRRRSLKGEEERASLESEAELERLRKAQAEDERALGQVMARRPVESAQRLVADELEAGGFLRRVGDSFEVTGRFLETLAGLIYAQESRGVSAGSESPVGASVEGQGILERTPLLSYAEASHMDVVGSIVQARQRHPHVRHLTEDDVLVYRERRTSVTHVVVILDRSLSMEENDRMAAAKRAALALYWGTKKRGSENRIDFVLMDTHVERASLSECWQAKPQGFTNTARALEVARSLLERSRSNRRLLFLVTDGLPEAYTEDGKDVAGRPEIALKRALHQAEKLRRMEGLEFRILLLEPDDPLFGTAAQKLAQAGRGTVHEVDPHDLARSLLQGLQESQGAVARPRVVSA